MAEFEGGMKDGFAGVVPNVDVDTGCDENLGEFGTALVEG
jgi:hypothetical protein